MKSLRSQGKTFLSPLLFWTIGALLVNVFALALTLNSYKFGYDWDVIDMPVVGLVAGLVAAGAIYFAAIAVFKLQHWREEDKSRTMYIGIVIAAGLLARLILFASEPMLEDDYQRYLWDGAVTAHGFNPYATSPKQILDAGNDHALSTLAKQSGPILKRVNHAQVTTIYPPVAEAAFAAAYWIAPFNLTSWRSILLLADIATLGLIFVLLSILGKSPLLAAVYWWNPVVLKEFFNSAHMDALVLPFVLLALLLATKSRPQAAASALALAAGTKLWPALLLPLILKRAAVNTKQVIIAGLLFCALSLFIMLPLISSAVNENSGLIAYATGWAINNPFYASLLSGVTAAGDAIDLGIDLSPSLITRGLIALFLAAVAIACALRPIDTTDTLVGRALLIVAALIFLSPAAFPWYTVWMLPLLSLTPRLGLLLLSVTVPLYYSYFYFAARQTTDLFHSIVVWLVWLPVWTVSVAESKLARKTIRTGLRRLQTQSD